MSLVLGGSSPQITFADGTVTSEGNGPAFSAYIGSGTVTIASATSTVIPLTTKNFDTGTCFNNTGSTVTLNGLSVPQYAFCPNVAGYYQVNSLIGIYVTGTLGTPAVYENTLYKNGTRFLACAGYIQSGVSGAELALCACDVVYLNGTGDYIQVLGYQATGSTQNIDTNLSFTRFSAVMIRGA